MRAVITRCLEAEVRVAGERVGALPEPGLLALVGVTHSDTEAEAAKLARKISGLRIFRDEVSALDLNAPILLVSQFTLYGDARKGRRPSWSAAAGRAHAEPLIEHLANLLRELTLHVETGSFGAMMEVSSVNDGPVTLLLDSAEIA